MKNETKPNLFISGFAKSGTTSIYHFLSSHPEVYCNPYIKEPRFFVYEYFKKARTSRSFIKNTVSREKDYLRLFIKAGGEKYIADGSVYYSAFPGVAQRLKDFNPESKVILSIRNPMHRFYSHYMMHVRNGIGDETLGEFIDNPYSEEGLNLLELGNYSKGISEYLDVFGKSNVHVAVFDDLIESPDDFFSAICDFLGIESVRYKAESYNMSGRPKKAWMNYCINLAKKLLPVKIRQRLRFNTKARLNYMLYNEKTMDKVGMPDDAINELKEYYRKDILETGDLIGRDLSGWLG